MRGLLDVLLPPACAGCGSAGALLCAACAGSFRPASLPAARFISADPAIAIGQGLCLALAAFTFEGPIRTALARLKYEGASQLARPLSEAAIPTLTVLLEITGAMPLVPVPVHRERLRERGYNQAELNLKLRRLAISERLPMLNHVGTPCRVPARPRGVVTSPGPLLCRHLYTSACRRLSTRPHCEPCHPRSILES